MNFFFGMRWWKIRCAQCFQPVATIECNSLAKSQSIFSRILIGENSGQDKRVELREIDCVLAYQKKLKIIGVNSHKEELIHPKKEE